MKDQHPWNKETARVKSTADQLIELRTAIEEQAAATQRSFDFLREDVTRLQHELDALRFQQQQPPPTRPQRRLL